MKVGPMCKLVLLDLSAKSSVIDIMEFNITSTDALSNSYMKILSKSDSGYTVKKITVEYCKLLQQQVDFPDS